MFRFCLNNYICTESRCNSWVHWLSTNHISIFMITSKKHIHFIPWFLYLICLPAVKTSNYFQGLMRALPHFLVSMFVCGFFVALVTITRQCLQIFYRHSALMANEQWGFFSVPHLLWHGTYVYIYNGGIYMVIIEDPWHTTFAERLTGEPSLPV